MHEAMLGTGAAEVKVNPGRLQTLPEPASSILELQVYPIHLIQLMQQCWDWVTGQGCYRGWIGTHGIGRCFYSAKPNLCSDHRLHRLAASSCQQEQLINTQCALLAWPI
jgi:hypothetical protein